MARIARLPTPFAVVLMLLIVVTMVSQAGSVPHSHSATAPGLFNVDHDLTLLAAANAVAVQAASPALVTYFLSTAIPSPSSDESCSVSRSTTDSRAPPLR